MCGRREQQPAGQRVSGDYLGQPEQYLRHQSADRSDDADSAECVYGRSCECGDSQLGPAPEVEVDLSKTGLTAGQAFEIRNSQDFYGAPVITGVYKAQKIMIPMGSLTVSSPVGSTPSSPVSTSPEFAALLVIPAPPSPPTTR